MTANDVAPFSLGMTMLAPTMPPDDLFWAALQQLHATTVAQAGAIAALLATRPPTGAPGVEAAPLAGPVERPGPAEVASHKRKSLPRDFAARAAKAGKTRAHDGALVAPYFGNRYAKIAADRYPHAEIEHVTKKHSVTWLSSTEAAIVSAIASHLSKQAGHTKSRGWAQRVSS